MAEIKLTKNELRAQQSRLAQLNKYLPTLQLKKAMLQLEVNESRHEIARQQEKYKEVYRSVENYSALLSEKLTIDMTKAASVVEIKKRYENIAGVEVPSFEGLVFADFNYNLFDTPAWVDPAVTSLRTLVEANIRTQIAVEKKEALEKELREVSIRVNLFEKVLIPRAIKNIKKIKVFLGDQQLTAVSQAKVAKAKILEHKRELQH